jgi:hypothetical protein
MSFNDRRNVLLGQTSMDEGSKGETQMPHNLTSASTSYAPRKAARFFMRFAAAVLFAGIAAASGSGQGSTAALSKDKLEALRTAGLSDSVLIQQIEKDGISFDMTADMTLELKGLGFSNDVLQALLRASESAPSAAVQPAQDDSVAALYRAGRFPELADRLKAALKANPTDYKTQALFVMTLLKIKEPAAAQDEFKQLAAHEQDPAAAPLVKQVRSLFDTLAKTQDAKNKMLVALKGYRAADAIAIVDQLPASPVQKEILRINLDLYQGKFDQARERYSKIPFDSYSAKERATTILDNINKTEAEYRKVMSQIDVYLHSSISASVCRFPLSDLAAYGKQYKELASLTVTDYVAQVNALARLAPLSDDARNLTFHAALLSGNYDQMQAFGDQLLKDRGVIRIPFFSSDRFFQLVIDSRNKHIYTEDDSHPFQPKWPTKSWSELEPFNLSFDQIKTLSQKGGHWHWGISSLSYLIVSHSYALKFEPRGLAPNYALMNILYCTAGEKAELTVTHNLGQYVLHVADNSRIKAELAEPNNAAGAPNGLLTGLLMAGASMSSNAALASTAVQGLQAEQAQQMASFQTQQDAWDSFTLASDSFNFLDVDAFSGLEELLGVLN